jgi:hypothetical protein
MTHPKKEEKMQKQEIIKIVKNQQTALSLMYTLTLKSLSCLDPNFVALTNDPEILWAQQMLSKLIDKNELLLRKL